MRIRLSVVRRLAAALIWGGLLSLPAHAAGKKSGGALIITDDLVGASAGTVGASGGAFTLDGTLSPVAASTGGIVVAPFFGNEAGYLSMMATTPVNASFLPVTTATVTVQWSVSNPTGTLYLIDASTKSDFTGTVFSTSIYNSSFTTFGGLHANATYYLRYKANYMEGDETAFHSLGSTRTAMSLPVGCLFGYNVKLDGSEDFTSIQSAINALPVSLSVPTCIVVRDTQTYVEQVAIEGFTNNGFQLQIMGDPAFVSSAPVVSPPGAMTAGFVIKNASVTLQNFMVRPAAAVSYGVQASSAYVTISSVNVDAGAFVSAAGISLSSWSALSYSSITVQSAYGLLIAGSTNSVSNSTITNNSGTKEAVLFAGASFNAFTRSLISNSGPYHGLGLDSNANGNAISLSTMTTSGAGASAFYIANSSLNLVDQSYMYAPAGNAAYFLGAATYGNTISRSTMAANSAAQSALLLSSSSSNTISQCFMTNPLGTSVSLGAASNGNTISLSTMISSASAFYALYLNNADSNTVTGSYISNPAGTGVRFDAGSDYNTISASSITGSGAGNVGLWINSSVFNGVSGSYISNPAAYSVLLTAGADNNTISQSTMASSAVGGYALDITGSSSNTVTGSFVSNPPGYAAFINNAASYNTISLSTITSSANGFPALLLAGSISDTIYGSYIQGSTAAVVQGSTRSVIGSSVLVATSTIGSALVLQGQGINGVLTVSSSTLRGGPSGRGLLLDAGNSGAVSIGSVTMTGSARGLEISAQAAGFALAVDSVTFRGLTAGATAIHYLGGTFSSTFTLANFEDSSVGANVSAAALNTFSRVTMFAHYGTRTGPAYENDPNSLVNWEAGPYPGCVVTKNVGAGQPYATIQSAINALPATLTGRSCVVIRDGAVYNEEVSVRNFINNGSSITILGDPSVSTRPVVAPNAGGGFAAFEIANASVVVAGIRVTSNVAKQYGIFVSSAYVTISSVSVLDQANMIGVAGIAASSWTTVSYTSVTVSNAWGILLPGSTMTVVSYSTAVNSNATRPALYLLGASSNTITGVTASNPGCAGGSAASIENGTYNQVDRSSFTTPGNNCSGLRLYVSSFNVVSGSFLSAPSGYGAQLISGHFNQISQSTMAASNTLGYPALSILGSSSNTVTGSLMWNTGDGVRLEQGANYNNISQSTMTSSAVGYTALYLLGSSSNTITQSYMTNPAGYAAWLDNQANRNAISQSTMASNTSATPALWLSAASSNTITLSFVTNPLGDGAILQSGADYNTISLSTMISNSAARYALQLAGSDGNTVTGSYLQNGSGTAARLDTGSDHNAISLSTMIGNAQYGLYANSADSNTVTQSYMQGFLRGVFLDNGSDYNTISLSTMIGATDFGLFVEGSDSNTVTRSYMWGSGVTTRLSGGSDYNTISLSTMISPHNAFPSLFIFQSSSNAILSCYVEGSTGAVVSGSTGTVISSSFLVATNAIGTGLALQDGSLNLTVASTTLRGGSSGRGLLLDAGNFGSVSIGSVTVTGSARGLEISTQAAGFILTVDSVTFRGMTAGATAIHYLGGSFVSTFTLANFEDASVGVDVSAAALNTASRITMFAHYGARTGPTYENDPNSLVNWEAGPYPGCVATRNVGLGQPYATITAGLAALPTTLTGHSCVVIRDGGSYNEQVIVSGFTNNGSSITIMADPAASTAAPRVSPPPGTAAFWIMNSSVNLAGIEVRPTIGPLQYGVSVSSPYVTISSVIVSDSFGAINTAGILLSSWTTVSYTSVTVADAYAFQLTGSTMSTVSYSSAANAGAGAKPAVLLSEASGNAFTAVLARGLTGGTGIRIDGGGYNTVSQSSVTSGSGTGFHLNASSFNAISGTYMSGPGGYGLRLEGSNGNTISQSTAVSNMAAMFAIALNNSSSNSLAGVFASNPSGYGAYFNGSSSNTVSLSTFNSGSLGEYGLYLTNGTSNTITGSYISNTSVNGTGAYFNFASTNTLSLSTVVGGAAVYGMRLWSSGGNSITGSRLLTGAQLDGGSNNNIIAGSTFTHNSNTLFGLRITQGSSNTVTQSFMTNPLGYGLAIGGGGLANYNTVSQSTITTNTGTGAASLAGTGNGLVADYISGGTGYGAEMNNSNYGAIAQSTITNNSAAFPAIYFWSSATNTITQSVVSNVNSGGNGVLLDNGSNWNSFERNMVKGGASGIKAQYVSGLNVAFSTVTGGSAAANAGVWGDIGTEYITLSNSYVQGSTAVCLGGSSRTIVNASVLSGTGAFGSGLWLIGGQTLSMSSNTVLGGGAAGIGLEGNAGGAIILSTNTVVARTAQYGIGVANLNASATLWITSNTVFPALSASATTYGVILFGLTGGATVQNNNIFYRTAGAAFSAAGAGAYGVYAEGSSGVRIDHNRISNPSMVTSGNYIGAALANSPSAIFKFNDLNSTGGSLTTFNQLRITGSANAVIRNNILSSSMTATTNRIIVVDAPSEIGFSSDYNTFFSSNASYSGSWGGAGVSLLANWISVTGRDVNTLSGNPLWANPGAGVEDFHPLSRGGRWDGAAFVVDSVSGPGLDRGDPAESVGLEGAPNGARANQGSYGQAVEGSRSVLPCPITLYVRQAGDGDAVTIQDGINGLPNPLTAHSCIVVGDSGIYNEQVTVQGFTNNGSSITIMLDPLLTAHPTVRSGFVVKNASVNIVNIDVAPVIGIPYGILASSANISISSVNVYDPSGNIAAAGVALSSYSSLSYSSISVQGAHGLRLDGTFAVVTNSTMTSNGAGDALFVNGADSNTVTGSYISNAAGVGAYLLAGADYNTISQSTMSSGGAGTPGIYLSASGFNTVTGSYMAGPSGTGAIFDGGSSHNTISQSVMFSASGAGNALNISNADSNTVTGCSIFNPNGGAAYIDVSSDYNTISQSTITSAAGGVAALNMSGATYNTITGSFLSNPAGYGARLIGGANSNTISQSTMANNGGAFMALYITASASNTVTGSYMANPLGYGATLDSNANYNTISLSTITSNESAAKALSIVNSKFNTVTRSFVSNSAGEGARLSGGADYNTISLSTLTSGSSFAAALAIAASSSNTIASSYIQGSTAAIISGSTGTVINSSVLVATNTVGSALALQGGGVNLALSSNTIIAGPQGAGVYLDGYNAGTISLSTNTIFGGHYGVYVATQQAGTKLWVTSNTIVPAIVDLLITHGIYLNGLTSGATIQNNGIYYRTPGSNPGSYTAGLTASYCDGVVIAGNRISNPGMVTGRALGVGLDHCPNTVFKFNDVHSTGTAISSAYHMRVDYSPGVQLRDNVFSSSWSVTNSTAALFVDAASVVSFVSDYNDFFSSNSFNSVEWGGNTVSLSYPWSATTGQDGNSISRHPRWKDVSPGVEDFHHLSQAGRWNGTAFVNDGFTSDLLDKANPADSFSNEAAPNGSRANLGSYGNTAEASKTPPPPTAPAVAGVFTSSISVSYGLVSANGYVIGASTAADMSGTFVSSTTANGALALLAPQGLAANTTYFLRTAAVWGDFLSVSGVLLTTSTLANPPSAASPAFGEVDISSLTASWLPNGNSVDVTTYSAVLSTGSSYPNAFAGNVGQSTIPAGALPSATQTTGLSPNTTYFAYAAAVNWNGVPSAFTALGSTATLAAAPLTAVSTFSNVGFSSFTVSWSPNGNPLAITTYTVTVSTASDFNAFASSVSFSTVPALGPSATFTGLGANAFYFFRVRALNHNGVPSGYAVLGSTETRPVTLQAPAIAGVTAVYSSSIAATWGLSALATGYTLVASLTNDPTAVFASSSPVGINVTTATVFAPALNPNTTYFLFVRATGPGAATSFSAYPATSTLAGDPVTAVSTFSSVFPTSMTVSWLPGGNPVGVTTYTVVLSTGAAYPNAFGGNRTVSTAPAGAGPAASFTGLSDNTAYFMYVAAVNHNGVTGGFVALGSTVTQISAPATVVFDEISSNTIVASAYAPAPLFSNLAAGLSGTRVARNGAYLAFHGEQWAAATAMPTLLRDAAAAGFNGKVYLFGGFNGAAVQNTALVYDPAAALWTTLTNLPTPRGGHAAAAAGGKIYAVGGTADGFTSLNVNEEYDPVTNSWTTKTALAVRSDHLSAAGVAGALYAFGGLTDGVDNMKTVQYDPAVNAWTNRPDFPAAQHQMAAAAAAGPMGGLVVGAGGSGPANSNYAFDSAANTWSLKTAMPAPAEEAAAASLGGKIFVIGGAPASKTVYEYDPSANAWTSRAFMTTGRAGLSVVAAGGRIYALGGTVDGGVTSLGLNEEYDPGTATKFTGLAPNTQAGFKAQARNQSGTRSGETTTISTWTWAALPATAASTFTVVEVDSITFQWTLNGNPGATEFKARASTAASYGGGAAVLASDWGAMTSTAALALSPNTTYFFSVQARNGIGGVPGIVTAFVPLGSTATLAAVPAPAPVPFPAAATNGVTVSWLPNGNPLSVTTYTVVVSTDAAYPNAHAGNVTIASTQPAGGLPTASFTGLVANTTYFAFASAVNWNGLRTAYAALGSTATLALPPAAASPAFAAVNQSSATFSWLPNGNPVNVTTYSVVLSTGGAFNAFAGNVAFSTSPTGALPTASVAAGLIANTTYFGYAAAINWNGAVSAYASLGSTATLAVEPATAVTTFTAVQISSLTVSWSAVGNPLTITTYTVQLSTAADFNAFATSVTFSTAPAAGPSATFTGLTDYTQYFFRVRAVNHGGTPTAFVNLGSTTTVIAPLGVPAPAGFPSVDITSVTATWGLVTGATGYTLVASLLPANPPTVVAASSTTMSIAATTAAALAPALSPNTTYFLFVQANGPLRSSLFASYGSTSTLASEPATAVSTFNGVGITSFTVSWSANGNALAITTYTVQLSTASDFNTFATSVTFTTAPVVGTSAMLTGLSGNTSYYLRIRALNHNGVASAFVSLGSTLTVASPLFPTVLNSQTGDPLWRRANTTLYSVAFLDTSGSHLDKFQVKASTTALGLGTDIAPFTDVVVGLLPSDTYNTPWALPASVFNSLLEGVTNYITVKVFNGPPLNNFTILQDAFYVQKDTTPPVFVNTQAGDSVARSAAGTTYTVGVRDPSSGLAAFQYSASLVPGTANAALIGWTDIAVVANTTSYNTPWPVNFTALASGVTNYISVRSWDTAGATTTLTDAFFVHKDTTGPSVAIASPQNGSFDSALTTLSGTAASIYGVKGTEVSVLDVGSGFYWNPASVAFNSAAAIMMPAAGSTAWTLSPGITWVDGATYRAVARSSTTANIYSTTYATATFVMDLSKPAVGVLAPAPNSTVSVLPQISGTAADPAPNPSGLSSVEVRLRRNGDGMWWNWFTQAWGPTAVSSITAGTAAWSLSPTPQLKASLANGASYFIAVRASDNALPANQGDFFVSGATFTWQDTTPPSAVADLAASHGSTPGSINLAWTAAGDDAGVGTIMLGEYRIFYSTDIAVAASTSAAQVIISTAGVNPGAAQAYTLAGLSPSVTYYVRLALADSDGNWSGFSNQASTTAAPSPLNAITGHVLDVSTQGITAVQVDCWNSADALMGTTFTLADGSGTFTVNGLPPGAYKLRVTWTVNGFSSSLWQDGIAMGSTNVDFFLNINYALATLTGTLGTLTASSFGGGGLGTASVSDSFIELYQKGQKVAKTTVQPTGRWKISGLLPGSYSVRAYTSLGYTPFQDVQLAEGEVRVLGFVFDPLPEASVFAFPNPARTATTIRFETALAPLEAGIYIFDIAGNLVKEISDSQISRAAAPTYRAAWDLNNSSGRPVAPGVYHVMVKIKGGTDDQTAKVIKKLAVVR